MKRKHIAKRNNRGNGLLYIIFLGIMMYFLYVIGSAIITPFVDWG